MCMRMQVCNTHHCRWFHDYCQLVNIVNHAVFWLVVVIQSYSVSLKVVLGGKKWVPTRLLDFGYGTVCFGKKKAECKRD